MLHLIPWRPLRAVVWDAFQSFLQNLHNLRPGVRALPAQGIPVFIMMPLDTALPNAHFSLDNLDAHFKTLAKHGVHGLMLDVWWGLCEPTPGHYDFSAYVPVVKLAAKHGLKLQATMCFHACGGNVGDSVNIPLPDWVLASGDVHAFWFTDQVGTINRECISFGADHEPVLPATAAGPTNARTPLQAYADFVRHFVAVMDAETLMRSTITELQIGMGPCGELRYPSYPMSVWKFPGIGQFQCFDKYLLGDLGAAVGATGSAAVRAAKMPPDGLGCYNDKPKDSQFFRTTMHSEAGAFFLRWYSDRLIEHGKDVLRQVRAHVPQNDSGVAIAVKISGVHWWKFARSRAAEATTGYIGANGRPTYEAIAKLFKEQGVVLDFTCLEMRTIDQPLSARCGPRQLVAEVFRIAKKVGVPVAGENALQTFEEAAFKQIASAFRRTGAQKFGFTLLRMCDDLMQKEALERLQKFTKAMRAIDAGGSSA